MSATNPSKIDEIVFTSRPLRVNTTPREFISSARQKEAMSTTSTSSSSTRGPLSFLEQIRDRCEPFTRAIMGTPQLDDHSTADSSTSADLKEIKNLLKSLIIDIETLKEMRSARQSSHLHNQWNQRREATLLLARDSSATRLTLPTVFTSIH
ncbi:hypothetical protein CRE_30390 [Caenorhabditis remanei]|uniref:Uncharacterized protein n=1 Tax=Caenorhabditis remanei TaxID=31234 RepID=E3N610_CAERE|nr:hypothetical protein CRE_30390 [Caenorhabditis remanei]